MLDELLKENGIKGGCLRMYKEKFKQPNFKLWCVPTQQQRDSDPEHCPELFYDSKEVLPTHEWLPAVQQAYAEYEAQASSTKQKPIAEKVKALMNLLGKHICVRGKQFGISIQYVTTYVQQCQQHVDTQHACMPDLADTESELHFFFQPKAAVQRPPQLLLRPRKLQVEMKMDPMPDPEAESSRYVAVCRLPRNQCIEYAYDTGNPEDAVLRSRKLQVLSERQYVTDGGGQPTPDTLDVFNNQQIMKTCKQRVRHLDMHDFRGIATTASSSQEGAAGNLQVTADEAHVAAVQSDVSLQTGENTQKAVLLKCCTALDVAVELTQLQHLNTFALTERPHQGDVQPDGSLELKYFCSRGPNASQPYITQYVPLGDVMQRRSISIRKKCGCGCYVKVRYPQGSFPDLCPVSRKPFTADTAVHKAVIQQQHRHFAERQDAAHASNGTPLISSQQEATAETSSQSGAAADQVQIWGQLQHTGHTPGTKESEKHLPIDEVSTQSPNNYSAILPMTPILMHTLHALQRFAAKADKWLHQHSPAEVEIMLERKQLQGMTCPGHRRCRIFLRELQNIVQQHKQERWSHPEAWPDFMAKLEHLSASEGFTVYVQDFDPSGKKPCVVFLQRHEQQQWLKQFEPTIVFVDSTHGTNSYNLQLFTAAIPCQARQGPPAAFCLIYTPDEPFAMQAAVSIFIQQLYLHNPELNPAAFMLDKDQSEHYAIGSVIVERALTALEDSIVQLDSLSSDQFEQMWSACTAKAQKPSMQCPSGVLHPLPASPFAPAAAHAAATTAATTTAASSITIATLAALAATVGTASAATAATDPNSSLCVDAYLAYLAARAKQDVASLRAYYRPLPCMATATSLCGPLQVLIKQRF
ncbi:TPA: hypothetical protein ACH3X2_006981 [Trebouxia sp. C0005]